MVEKEYYNGIDFVKFIMAIMVVMIHLTPFAMFGENINFFAQIMTRAAVPFFFCASVFFLKKKLDTCASDNEYYSLVKR